MAPETKQLSALASSGFKDVGLDPSVGTGSDSADSADATSDEEAADLADAFKAASGAEAVTVLAELMHAMGYRRPAGDE
jgi:tagatose-1,6-bisphosphate aldolase non-catalytic subunit AgaZ/GatZ